MDAAWGDAGRIHGVEEVGEVLRRQQWAADTCKKHSKGLLTLQAETAVVSMLNRDRAWPFLI